MSHRKSSTPDVTRRDALKTIAAGIGAAAIIPLIPAEAAAAAQRAVAARKAGAPLKVFTPAQHHTVDVLTELIIPADDRSPGATAARVADYLDFALSQSSADARRAWTNGLAALDAATQDQQTSLLTEASKNEFSPTTPLEKFFREAKSRTIFGYYTSEIAIHQELRYKGNQYLAEFVGCDHPEHMS